MRLGFQLLLCLQLLGDNRNAMETCNMKQGFALIDQRQMRASDENAVSRRFHHMFRIHQRCGYASDNIAL